MTPGVVSQTPLLVTKESLDPVAACSKTVYFTSFLTSNERLSTREGEAMVNVAKVSVKRPEILIMANHVEDPLRNVFAALSRREVLC